MIGKKEYNSPELFMAVMEERDVLVISGDPSMEDVEWASIGGVSL